MTEYVVWGVPDGQSEEQVLVALPGGKPITCKATAERFLKLMETKYNCRECRIQCVDGMAPDFIGAIQR